MQVDFAKRELFLKVVYYGPSLSGKTTNLQALHNKLGDGARGRLTQLDTRDDRTLFFDLLPVTYNTRSGLAVKLKVFTVPGQVMHNATRRVLLQGADGVVFVADSQLSQAKENITSFRNMRENLSENDIDVEDIPVVIQFNKRDLPDIRSDEDLEMLGKRSRELIFTAVAIRGEGVVETFHGLLYVVWKQLDGRHGLGSKFGITQREFLAGVLENFSVRRDPEAIQPVGRQP